MMPAVMPAMMPATMLAASCHGGGVDGNKHSSHEKNPDYECDYFFHF